MISIGILTYQRVDLLCDLLKDIENSSFPLEVIIINNNVDYDVYDDIKIFFNKNNNLKLNYIWDKVNYGVCLGRKKILDICTNPYLIFFDDDVNIPNIDCILSTVTDEFGRNEKLGGIAFRIIDFLKKKENKYEIPHKNKKINMNEDFYTYLMIGAGMAIKTAVAKSVGGFSSFVGPYGFEEIDLSYKIINSGQEIKYCSKCVIEHKKSPDGRFSNAIVNYYAFINRTLIAKKYMKYKYYYSCFIVRSIFFLLKTRDINMYFKAVSKIIKFKENSPFTTVFYNYCKKVSAFLYY